MSVYRRGYAFVYIIYVCMQEGICVYICCRSVYREYVLYILIVSVYMRGYVFYIMCYVCLLEGICVIYIYILVYRREYVWSV